MREQEFFLEDVMPEASSILSQAQAGLRKGPATKRWWRRKKMTDGLHNLIASLEGLLRGEDVRRVGPLLEAIDAMRLPPEVGEIQVAGAWIQWSGGWGLGTLSLAVAGELGGEEALVRIWGCRGEWKVSVESTEFDDFRDNLVRGLKAQGCLIR